MGRSVMGLLRNVAAPMMSASLCLGLTLVTFDARADLLGARISTAGTIVSIEQPEADPENEVTRFLFGPAGAVAAFIRRIDTARARNAPESVTVLLESSNGGSFTFLTSRSGNSRNPVDETFVVGTPDEFASALCRIAVVCGAQEGGTAGAAGAPYAFSPLEFASERTDAQLVVELGEFPGSAREILLRRNPRPPIAGAPSTQGQDPLSALIYRTVQDVARPDPAPALAAGAPGPSNRPVYFAVHCTAFYTSLDAAGKWVQRLKREGKRAKSHGVILADGVYHEIWPLAERAVYATKTETCPDTTASALGSIINIEMHYHCGYDGSNPNVLKEATPAQYKALAGLYLEARRSFGDLTILSHKEIDRGLRDGHQDPLGFSFAVLLRYIRELQPEVRPRSISDARHKLPSAPVYSHTWQPRLDVPPVLESRRADDCKRDRRR